MTVEALADLLDGESSWLDVRTADVLPEGPGWISCAEMLEGQGAGRDPTYGWRKSLQDDYAREYAIEPPGRIAAMFVLMWYVSVPSMIAGISAALTGTSPDVSPEGIAFRRHPTAHYPAEVALLSDRVVPMEEAAEQVAAHTGTFLETYRPGVILSSRQRWGAVEDEVRGALRLSEDAPHREAAAKAFGIELDQSIRTSCCFFYALPNVTACGGCPRSR